MTPRKSTSIVRAVTRALHYGIGSGDFWYCCNFTRNTRGNKLERVFTIQSHETSDERELRKAVMHLKTSGSFVAAVKSHELCDLNY